MTYFESPLDEGKEGVEPSMGKEGVGAECGSNKQKGTSPI